MSPNKSRSRRFAATAITIATLAALGVPSGPASAQFFSSSGTNISFPVNLFPIDPGASFLDFLNNTVVIGAAAPGSFAAQAGGVLAAAGLEIGQGGTGAGGVSLTGAGTRVDLSGVGVNRLQVGNWGTGTLTVAAGAVIDASTNTAGCLASGFCNSFVGNAAGSTGTMTITGAGSQVSLTRFLGVGSVSVFTLAQDGFDFGTPGGTTSGTINVLAGGALNTQSAQIGRGPNNAAALGTEQGFGNVLIDGSGSRWIATRNTVDSTDAFVGVGNGSGGHGDVVVRNGGLLRIDGAGGNPAGFAVLNIGNNGGQGSVTVTGAGSRIEVIQLNPVIQVGRSGAGATGSFSVLAGASAAAMFMNVGRDGATGTALIDGAGSVVTLSGVATAAAGGGPAFLNVGRGGGTGSMTVSGGAQLAITDGGGDTSAGTNNPGFILGRDAGSTGSMTITGPGSVVQVTSTSLGVAVGAADNQNPFVGIGYDNPGSASGQLIVANGGKLLLTGNGVSNIAFPRVTSLQIGGRNGVAGTGQATVTGAGSEIVLSGYDGFVSVGRTAGSNGTLSVLNQGRVAATSLLIADAASGLVSVDNARIELGGVRHDIADLGAGATVGRGSGGVGGLVLTNGALFTIENNLISGGMSVGGDRFVSGGTGTVSLTGGSILGITGSVAGGGLSVGRSGIGTLTVDDASQVTLGALQSITLGNDPGGAGTLSVAGGSIVQAGNLNLGGNSDTVAGGTATVNVSGPGSAMRAIGGDGFISVGRSGTGSMTLANQATLAGIVVNVGRAPGGNGSFVANNAVITLAGQQVSSGSGASFSVGNRGGTGTASLLNGTQLAISNPGGTANLNVGGTPLNPLGTGNLLVAGGSQVQLSAATGQATVRIGHDGTGTATFDASTLNVGDGNVIVAGQPGSVGTLTLSNGAVVNAGYVGVGASPAGPGGVGRLILDNSTINTTKLEIGPQGTLSGDGGFIHASGDVIFAGTLDPGHSPGRVNISCNIITLPGSRLLLDVLANGAGGFDVDRVIIGEASTFDLRQFDVVINFLGNTDPNAFAASGGFDMDTFLRKGVADADAGGLSQLFASGQTWTDVITASHITATSSAFDVTALQLRADGSFAVTAVPVPEPATWVMMLGGLLAIVRLVRRRSRP